MDPAKVAMMLRGQHARCLIDDSNHFRILEANESFADLQQCELKHLIGCSLKILYCNETNSALLEETLTSVREGCESTCGVILTQDPILLHVWCMFVMHGTYGKCKLCVIKPMAPPKVSKGVDYVAAAVSPLPPFHMVDVSTSWAALFGYSPEEMKGRGLKILQGPRTNVQEFQAFMLNIKKCIPAECTLLAYKMDGAISSVRFRLFPFEISRGKIAVMVQATQLSSVSNSELGGSSERSVKENSIAPIVIPDRSANAGKSETRQPTPSSNGRVWEVTFPPAELAELKANLRNELSRLSFRLSRSIIDAQSSDAGVNEQRADRRAAMEAGLVARGADVVVKALRAHCDDDSDRLALCAALVESEELGRVKAWKQPLLANIVGQVWRRALPSLATGRSR